MTKQVNVLPNLRIDIPDFEGATQGFTEGSVQERFRALIQDKFPHVPEGFRVEVSDQGSFPGQIIIHNGVSYDRDGRFVTSAAEADTNRAITLTGTATYYVEIEFTSEPSDVDSRGFWDPRYDNGTDPSGDPRPDGREFPENVSTRITPEWRIVTPVSTTDFEINTNPNSTRIPVAIIDVVLGVVSGASTVPLRTTLREDIAGGVNSFKVMNSRSMPQTFTATIDTGLAGEETVVVAANDAVNGILTLAGVTAAPHNAGARVSVAGGTPEQYLPHRTDPALPTAVNTDARPRVYQGNEEVGHALIQNSDLVTGQGDVQIDDLKNYVDFLAAQIRQMKVGAARGDQIGITAPPAAFSADFRYYENAGGILGARTNTVSVGDGVNSWGDFNTTQAGDAPTAIQAAIDAIPVGGILYIKAGTYDMTSLVTVDKPIHIIGDGVGVTILDTSSAAAAMDINTAGPMSLRNMSITASGASVYALTATLAGAQSVIENCAIEGLNSTLMTSPVVRNTTFSTSGTGDDALLGVFTDFLFENCTFDCSVAVVAARAVNIASGTTKGRFVQCAMSTSSVTPGFVIRVDESVNTNVKFHSCSITGDAGGTSQAFEFVNSTMRDIHVIDCDVDCPGGIGAFPGSDPAVALSEVLIDSCRINVPANGFGLFINGSGITVKNCAFTQASSGAGTTGEGIHVGATIHLPTGTTIEGCSFVDCDRAIVFFNVPAPTRHIIVKNNKIDCPTASRGRVGILFEGTTEIEESSFDGNLIRDLDDDSGAVSVVYGIELADTAQLEACSISDNIIRDIGGVSLTNLANAYGMHAAAGAIFERGSIVNNLIDNVQADIISAGIWLECTSFTISNIIIDHNRLQSIGSSAGDTLASQVAYGIVIRCGQYITISNNIIRDICTVSATTATTDVNHPSAVLIGTSGLGEDIRGICINNNVIQDLAFGGTQINGIALVDNCDSATISGNVLKSPSGAATNAMAIYVVSINDDIRDLSNIAVVGNTITLVNTLAPWNIGIYFQLVNSGAGFQEGIHTVCGNTIQGVEIAGIRVLGTALNNTGFAITGNSIVVEEDAGAGIRVADIFDSVISGNVVDLEVSNAAAVLGISATSGSAIAVVGNSVFTAGSNAGNIMIDVTDTVQAVVGSNIVRGGPLGTGIQLNRDDQIASGNNVSGFAASGTPIALGGGLGIKVLVDNSTAPATPVTGTLAGTGEVPDTNIEN